MNRPQHRSLLSSSMRLSVLVCLSFVGSALAQEGDAPTADGAAESVPRVFVAKISAGEGASAGEASLLNDTVLVAIKKYETQFDIRTSQDIEGIVKLEVAQTMAGCDIVSCAAEIGDALGADQLVTGQLGRVGKTWILSLTRTERSSLKALARTQVRAVGAAPDVLFPLVEAQTAELFGQEAPIATKAAAASGGGGLSTPLLIGGGVGLGLSVVAAGVGGALYYLALESFDATKAARTGAEFDNHLKTTEGLYNGAVATLIASGLIVVVSGATMAASFLVGDSE